MGGHKALGDTIREAIISFHSRVTLASTALLSIHQRKRYAHKQLLSASFHEPKAASLKSWLGWEGSNLRMAESKSKGETGGSVAWIAIEDPKAPWPNLAKRKTSAGPFYLVWQHPERSKVGSEEWPYALVALTGVDDPVSRWPQLAIDPSVAAGAAEHRGQAAFIKNCIPCHRLNGAGESNTGPDLGQPMNVTAYMTTLGIHALIRDPKSVRTWPDQRMPGFDAQKISDADIDAIIAFLAYTAKQ